MWVRRRNFLELRTTFGYGECEDVSFFRRARDLQLESVSKKRAEHESLLRFLLLARELLQFMRECVIDLRIDISAF